MKSERERRFFLLRRTTVTASHHVILGHLVISFPLEETPAATTIWAHGTVKFRA
jgi:hypothetical protein